MNGQLIDTHAHIYLDQFSPDLEEVMKRADAAGVARILMPNIDSSTIASMLLLEEGYPNRCWAMMGLHPCSVNTTVDDELQIVRAHLEKRPYIAVGEIGIDLHWDTTFRDAQIEAFKIQTQWALEKNLPIVIHSRKSLDLILDLLEQWDFTGLRGVFHCFGGDEIQAGRIIELGFLMGIGGVLTFKNSNLRRVLREVALEHLIVETDAPYLTPAPHRGKRNEPAYVALVADLLGDIYGMDVCLIGEVTTNNAMNLFFEAPKTTAPAS